MRSVTQADRYTCANCAAVIRHRPVIHVGVTFCCAGCAAGGPCTCSYDLPEEIDGGRERPPTGRARWPMTAAAWSALTAEIERLEVDASGRLTPGMTGAMATDPARRRWSLRAVREGASIVELSDEAAIGRRVTIRDDDGSLQTYAIVLPGDGEPSRGWLSADSPLGDALLGARPGERVLVRAPGGARWVDVVSVDDP